MKWFWYQRIRRRNQNLYLAQIDNEDLTMSYAIPFPQLNKNNIPVAGGKGANLGEMTMAGFPVPSGFVLTTQAYDAFVRTHNLQQQIIDLAHTVSADVPQSGEDASVSITQLFLGADIPGTIVDALMAAYDGLGNCPVAVRSSATAEDLPDASFAGQQETYLNVQGKAALLSAVKQCWASLWTARAITYRLKQEIAPDEVSLAVVLQKQIESEVSGVAFSLNPNNNCYDEAVINSNFGLGETIVSGQVTPDNFVVDKVSHEIVQKQLATKDYVLVGKAGGGMEEQTLEDPNIASLSDEQVIAVTELVTKVETHYEMPMDIEWAYEEGELYLLQARPITTYVPLPEIMITEPGAEKYLYLDLIVLTQGFQESLSVLGNEIFGKMMEQIKGDVGMFDRGMDGAVLNIEGRHYLHMSNIMKGLGMRAASSIWKTYDTPTRKILDSIDLKSYVPAEKPDPMRGLMWKTMKYAGRVILSTLRGMRNPDKAVQQYEAMFAQDVEWGKHFALKEMPFSDLVNQLLDHFKKQMDIVMAVMGPSMMARKRLEKMFKEDEVEDLLVALEMDLRGNPTSEMGHLMFALARFPEVQQTETGEEFSEKLGTNGFSPEFMQAYQEYMDRFGCRNIREIDIATERPYDNVPEFFKQLKAMDIHNDMLAKVAKRRADAYEQLLALATKKGKAKKFKRQAVLHNNAGYREKPKYFFIISLDLMRQRALSLGKEFVAQGRLDTATQVFDMNVAQISESQQDSSLDLRGFVETNLAPRAKQSQVQEWPRIIDSRGMIFRAKREPAKAGELIGDPIAPGIVRGTANVLHSPYEKLLNKGEILVTRSTDPGWTPLFMNADGVVLEVGGALQHGAVIAREYGLPCVSGVGNATGAIMDGQMIEVDGSNGVVRIVEAA
jgi:pyruvate,water dikinase